jgi:small subunit ribosomal protein S17
MPKRILYGEVVSDKNDKTVIVKVTRKYMHPIYKKILKRTKRYAAHDENNTHKVGDMVKIVESRPISATKTWIVM